jgi:hypothetical protein
MPAPARGLRVELVSIGSARDGCGGSECDSVESEAGAAAIAAGAALAGGLAAGFARGPALRVALVSIVAAGAGCSDSCGAGGAEAIAIGAELAGGFAAGFARAPPRRVELVSMGGFSSATSQLTPARDGAPIRIFNAETGAAVAAPVDRITSGRADPFESPRPGGSGLLTLRLLRLSPG